MNYHMGQVTVYQGSDKIEVEREVIVFPNYVSTVMFFDDGSSCSIITHLLAGFLGAEKEGGHPLHVGGLQRVREA